MRALLPLRSACLQMGSGKPRVRVAYPGYVLSVAGQLKCTKVTSSSGWKPG